MKASNNNTDIESAGVKQTITSWIWKLLEAVADPEIPVIYIIDLGIVRDVVVNAELADGGWEGSFVITPSYTGCHAMNVISMDIKMKLFAQGYKNIKVNSILSPAWTTDWMSEGGKEKLKVYGIAPPNQK